ncbi:MAG: hypothetical protein AAGJ81_10655 [Verrucomicrobiota bacterium]
MGKRSQEVQAKKRMAGPTPDYPPMLGELLMVERVTRPDFASVEYVIRQGDRANRIAVSVFGRVVPGLRTWSAFYAARRRGIIGLTQPSHKASAGKPADAPGGEMEFEILDLRFEIATGGCG